MGPVWLQGTIHASYNRIHHQSAAHLSAAGLSWLWASVQEGLCPSQPFTALSGGRGDAEAGVTCPQPLGSARVCAGLPPPAVSPTGGLEQQLGVGS